MMKACVCGHPMTRHDWKNQWVCHRCGRTKPIKEYATNADRIRAMSDEELAELLCGIQDDDDGRVIDGETILDNAPDQMLWWLREVSE